MEINKKYKLEKAVSPDETRTSLMNIFVTRRHAAATNGHILAIVPVVSDKRDKRGWLSAEALKLGRKVTPKALDTVQIALDGKQVLADGTAIVRPDGRVKPPCLFRVLRKAYKKRRIRFGINTSFLKDLAESIGSEEVILEIGTPDQSILVRPIRDSNGEVGLIMPVKVRD
ncbi:MAG: hypothetical protein ABSF91_11500 [Bacteroidota bacterium]|jgi:DNA polymerase III sliding clamp (beta) subunit (PCNA family)